MALAPSACSVQAECCAATNLDEDDTPATCTLPTTHQTFIRKTCIYQTDF